MSLYPARTHPPSWDVCRGVSYLGSGVIAACQCSVTLITFYCAGHEAELGTKSYTYLNTHLPARLPASPPSYFNTILKGIVDTYTVIFLFLSINHTNMAKVSLRNCVYVCYSFKIWLLNRLRWKWRWFPWILRAGSTYNFQEVHKILLFIFCLVENKWSRNWIFQSLQPIEYKLSHLLWQLSWRKTKNKFLALSENRTFAHEFQSQSG